MEKQILRIVFWKHQFYSGRSDTAFGVALLVAGCTSSSTNSTQRNSTPAKAARNNRSSNSSSTNSSKNSNKSNTNSNKSRPNVDKVSQERWGPKVPRRVGGPKFRLFFQFSFHSLCTLWASSRGMSVVFVARLEFSGSSGCPVEDMKNQKINKKIRNTKSTFVQN